MRYAYKGIAFDITSDQPSSTFTITIGKYNFNCDSVKEARERAASLIDSKDKREEQEDHQFNLDREALLKRYEALASDIKFLGDIVQNPTFSLEEENIKYWQDRMCDFFEESDSINVDTVKLLKNQGWLIRKEY